jgi:hypothetical protein
MTLPAGSTGEGVRDEGRVAGLAERLDFAERLLAQKRERSLPGA